MLFARFAAGAATPPPRPLAWLARGSVLVAFALIVSGAFSTAAGPHAGGEDIRRMGNLLDTTYVHVRVATTYIIVDGACCCSSCSSGRGGPIAGGVSRSR